MLEDSNGDVSSGDDSAYEGEGMGYRYQLPMLMNGLGLRTCMTWTLHASAMDERPGEGSLCDSGK